MQIMNAPGKVKVSPSLVRADARHFKRQAGVSAILTTEMADNARAAALSEEGDGFTLTHDESGPGKGECAILTRDAMRTVDSAHWIKLTDGGGTGRLAHPIYALAVVTTATDSGRVTLLTGAHLPAHIEGIWARIPLPDRLKLRVLFRRGRVNPGILAWIEAVHRWRLGVAELAAKHHVDDVVVAPDGNVDAGRVWVREMLGRAWPGLVLAATKRPDLGRRTVGWVLSTMEFEGGRVFRAESSDHDAGLYQLHHLNPPKHQPKPKNPPPPFSLCTYSGVRMTHYLKTALQVLERGRLADLAPLTVLQGDMHPGVGASAGTHDRAGVVDLAPAFFGRKVGAWRDIFGPGWHRKAIPGVWGEHCHMVVESCSDLAPMAAQQVVQYHEGLDGLADHARDPNQHHPRVTWDFETAWHELNPT